MNEILKKRLFSLAWRIGAMVTAAGIGFVVENATELGVPSYAVALLGLVLGEVTKFINSTKK